MCAGLLAGAGTNEAALRLGVRATARSSLLLFLLAFAARPLAVLRPSASTKWLLRNRRQVGVSLMVSQAAHAAFIVALWVRHPQSFFAGLHITTELGGLLGYVFLLLMTATSFDRSAALIGRRAWKALHTSGMYYLWGVFVFTYAPAIPRFPMTALPTAALLLAMGLRLVAARRPLARRASAD
jgi:DMSO/TMAO reductase YedYZ heme-binding membrane subunit